jgi:hypothetical protein
MSKIIVSHILSVIVVGDTENRRRIKEAITVVMGLRDLLKGTYFSNSIDEFFFESYLF